MISDNKTVTKQCLWVHQADCSTRRHKWMNVLLSNVVSRYRGTSSWLRL